jgi:hypothetical protein
LKYFLIITCAVGLVALSLMWSRPWLGGVGLLVGFCAMWMDRDPVRVEGRERDLEGTLEIRRMRKERE